MGYSIDRTPGGPEQVKRVFARVVHEAQETLEPFGVDRRRLELQLEAQSANTNRKHKARCGDVANKHTGRSA